MYSADFIFVLKWWFLFLLIGLSFLPFTSKIFHPFIDRGYIFSKIIGTLLISYSIFILSYFHILKFTQINLILVWILLVVISYLLLKKQRLELKESIRLFIVEEFIFFVCLLIWSIVRSYQPSIHDLEKFMDFGFVNSILRTEYFPPRDMWLTPFSINYYYFGHLFTAVLTKLSQIPSFISFNLMIATIFAFTFSASFSLGINLIQKIKKYSLKKLFIFGLIFGYIVSLAGNLQTIYSFFKTFNPETPLPFWKLTFSLFEFPNAYWYPNATRFIYHTIHEFPSYSFVVADLHGHVLDIPIVMTLIALCFVMFLEKKIRLLILLSASFLLAIAYMTNAWDGLLYLGLFMVVAFVLNFMENKSKKEFKKITQVTVATGKQIIFIFLSFFIFTFIFNQNFSPFASGIGLNCSPKFLLSLQKLGPFVFENGQCQHSPWWQLLILYGFFLYMVISFLIFLRKKKSISSDYFALTISLFSLLLIIIPEFFYLKDIYTAHFRANTMFKLAYQASIMLYISSVYILIRIIASIRSDARKLYSRVLFIVFAIFSFLLLFLVSIYPYFSIPSGYGNLTKYQGLDGIKYLKEIKPQDYDAINWINKNIEGQPVILETQGDSYTDFARISSNTGLPTVLGWIVHEWLWRGSYDVPSARFDDIKNLYESTNLKMTKDLFKKYNISYVYIGQLEREKYNIYEDKFIKLAKIVYSNKNTKIYKIY
ncbi:MAG: DUF2298 domain-containing protein [Patescibacteria group bacterium]